MTASRACGGLALMKRFLIGLAGALARYGQDLPPVLNVAPRLTWEFRTTFASAFGVTSTEATSIAVAESMAIWFAAPPDMVSWH